ncbi:tape measure protein [Acinetobacter bereziniae]|uniref:tape measure protein n=1 Tax=Acinetobacter bereziniae TaxID=106648 RepID=UPI002074C9DF|nr:tape measure protein [Acinetobacter bereziniae]MCM8510899.1 tape measure protein [Acinetobacter bereziniae]
MTEQTSRLVIEISSEQAKKNAEELSKELVKIFTGGEKASDSTSKLGKTIQVTSNITQNFNTTVNNTTKAVEKQTQELAKQEKQVDKTGVAIKTLAGHLAAFITINSTIDKMDSYTGLQNRLKLVTNSQTELNRAMNDTFAIAQNTRQSWESAAQVYQGFANNAKALGLSMSDTARLTETVSKAVAISGSSAQASEAALIQFNQALSSGTLRGEELNSVMEQTPGLAKAIAEGMGITVGQLRSVAATGSITSAELVKALTKAKASVDNLFSKTDITIGQSITLLNNELGKFVGEAGQSSGAAKTLADAIQLLSQNLGPLADGAMVVGIGYLTKSFLDKAVATRTAIAASVQHQTSMLAEQAATVELTGVEALRARQNVVLAAQEVRSAELALVNAKSKDAQALATQRLAAAEVAHNVALKESTIATAQYTLAQDALNKSKALGSKLLTAIGGPIGALTLAAMGLAAGYTYLQKRADEANKKLEEQAAVAKRAKDELLALQGLEKDDAINKMTAAFKLQNEALTESSSKLNMQLNAIEQLYKGNKDVVKVVEDARNGTISMTDAVAKFNQLRISKEIYNSVKANTTEFVKNATEATNTKNKLNLFGFEVELAGRKAQTAKNGIDANTEALDKNASAAEKAATKLDAYIKSLNEQDYSNGLMVGYLNKGYSKEQAEALSKAWSEALATDSIVTKEQEQRILKSVALEKQKSDLVNERNQKEKENTKELDKQQKLQGKQAVLLAGNNEQTRNMLRVYQSFRNAGLGDKQARVMTAQVGRENDFRNSDMFGSHKDANNGYTNTGFISWQKGRSTQLMQFLQGQGVLDKNGKIQQSQDALDAMAKFLMQEIATGKSYGKTKNALNDDTLSYRELEKIVGQNFIGWDYNGKKLGKDKAAQHLSKQDNYFNQISKILGGNPENVMSSIKDLSKFEDEAFKARAKTEEEIKQLQAKYDTEAIQRSKARDEEINQATILGQTQLLPKIKERYDAQDKLAQLQIDEDLNSYKWTENQKLVYTYQTNKLRLDAEGKLNDDVKELAKKALDEQMLYETQKRLQANSLGIGQIQLDAQSYVRQKQNPLGFQQDQLDSETINKYRELQLKYSSQRGDIFTLVDDENARNQQLLDAHEKFLMARKALDEKYQVDQQDIARNQFDAQLSLYGRLISTTSTTWGSMTQIMRDSAGEQSAIYKLMFGIQQTMAIATATINAYQAYSSVLAEPLIPIAIKLPLANTILGLGMANVGMIAGQAIAGFSNGGYTGSGGKYDPAGIVHKGEVVFSQEDIARWGGVGNVEKLRKNGGYSDGGIVGNYYNERGQYDAISQARTNVASQPNIIINNYSNERVETSTAPNGDLLVQIGKMVDKKIDDGVDRGIQRNLKQGYPLDRAIKNRR